MLTLSSTHRRFVTLRTMHPVFTKSGYAGYFAPQDLKFRVIGTRGEALIVRAVCYSHAAGDPSIEREVCLLPVAR